MPTLVDTHCHVDLYPDPVAVIERARSADVAIVAVTETPAAYRSFCLKLGKRASHVDVALGAHPLHIRWLSDFQAALFLRLLPTASFLGEVGLDFSREGVNSKGAQISFFERLLSHPSTPQIPMTVHTRAAEKIAIPLLESARAKAILHWYSGPASLIDRALSAGMYFSVNPSMIRSKSGLRVLNAVPRERVLIETDGPFVKINHKACEPTDAVLVLQALATSWKLTLDEARDQLSQNLVRLGEGRQVEKLF